MCISVFDYLVEIGKLFPTIHLNFKLTYIFYNKVVNFGDHLFVFSLMCTPQLIQLLIQSKDAVGTLRGILDLRFHI